MTSNLKEAGCEEHTNSRANLWSDEQKSHMRSCMRVRLQDKLKPNSYTESYIGNLSFKGPAQDNVVEIGYGILPDQEGKGYTTEAVQAMTQWAFGNADVVFVEAETEPENRASRRILEKCGFVLNGEGPRFVLEKPLTNWMAIYMLFGISIGTTLGTFLGNVGIGISLGLCLGLSIGVALDSSAKKDRKKLLEQREDRKQK